MDKEKLVELAKDVAELRQDVEFAKGKAFSASQVMAETEEGKSFQLCTEELAKEKEALSEAETSLKTAVLEVYEETEERKPIDKVEVKIFESLKSDPLADLAWCRANAPTLLIVDKKAYAKTAVAIGAPVHVIKTAKCTIAKDLSSYLEAATESAA